MRKICRGLLHSVLHTVGAWGAELAEKDLADPDGATCKLVEMKATPSLSIRLLSRVPVRSRVDPNANAEA